MNSTLNNFFKEERKRVFEPGPYFTQRVMARLSETVPSIWEVIPRAIRPVMALSMILLFGVLAVQILIPVEPAGPGPDHGGCRTRSLKRGVHACLSIQRTLPVLNSTCWTLRRDFKCHESKAARPGGIRGWRVDWSSD